MFTRIVAFILGLPLFIPLAQGLPPIPIAGLLLPVIFVLGIVRQPRLSRLEVAIAILSAICIVTTGIKLLLGYFGGQELTTIIFTAQVFVWMWAFSPGKATTAYKSRSYLTAMVLGGTFYSVLYLIQGGFPQFSTILGPFIAYQIHDHTPTLLALLSIISVSLALEGRKSLIYWISSMLLLWVVFDSQSNTSQFISAFGVFLVVAYSPIISKSKRILLALCILPLIIILPIYFDITQFGLHSWERVITLNHRTSIWMRHVEGVFENVSHFFLGFNDLSVTTSYGAIRLVEGHNQFIDVLSRQGVVAFLFFVALSLMVLRLCMSVFMLARKQKDAFVVAVSISAMLALILNGLILPTFNQPVVAVPIWFCLGLLYSYLRKQKQVALAESMTLNPPQ